METKTQDYTQSGKADAFTYAFNQKEIPKRKYALDCYYFLTEGRAITHYSERGIEERDAWKLYARVQSRLNLAPTTTEDQDRIMYIYRLLAGGICSRLGISVPGIGWANLNKRTRRAIIKGVCFGSGRIELDPDWADVGTLYHEIAHHVCNQNYYSGDVAFCRVRNGYKINVPAHGREFQAILDGVQAVGTEIANRDL